MDRPGPGLVRGLALQAGSRQGAPAGYCLPVRGPCHLTPKQPARLGDSWRHHPPLAGCRRRCRAAGVAPSVPHPAPPRASHAVGDVQRAVRAPVHPPRRGQAGLHPLPLRRQVPQHRGSHRLRAPAAGRRGCRPRGERRRGGRDGDGQATARVARGGFPRPSTVPPRSGAETVWPRPRCMAPGPRPAAWLRPR